jgi:hypothetical protein
LELERLRRVTSTAHERKIVSKIYGQDGYGSGLSIRCAVLEPILARVLHPISHHMIVGYEGAAVLHRKTGPMRGLGSIRAKKALDLYDRGSHLGEHLAGALRSRQELRGCLV